MSKIGVAISTYNRQEYLEDLLNTLPFDRVDHVVVVKDGGGEEYDFNHDSVEYIEFAGNHGVATSKNMGIAMLLKHDVEHMFLLDDDVIIKDDNVFDEYINTAKLSGVYHLLFSRIMDNKVIHTHVDSNIDLFTNCCGAFMYVHRAIIKHVGDFDQRYINAYEHIDFYYRCEKLGLVPKFWWFPDVKDSDKFLMDHPNNQSTLFGDNLNKETLSLSTNYFIKKHGHFVNNITKPSLEHVIEDLNRIKTNYSR